MLYAGLALVAVIVMLEATMSAGTNANGSANGSVLTPAGSPATPNNWTIASVARTAGFTGSDLVKAIAIAHAESGGDPNAVGDTSITPGGSQGLWQINLRWHPEFAGWNLFDPQTNADAAFSVYAAAGNSFTPWSTFNNGAYETYMFQADSEASA